MLACAEGNPVVARTIIESGGARASARVGTRVLASPAPLHVAARYGHSIVVTTLLELGVPVDAHDTIGLTPLHYAAGNGHLKAVRVSVLSFYTNCRAIALRVAGLSRYVVRAVFRRQSSHVLTNQLYLKRVVHLWSGGG